MSAEKIIKNEAKSVLSKGNWIKAITAVMITFFVPMVSVLIMEISYNLTGAEEEFSIDVLTSSTLFIVFFALFQLIGVAVFVLLSPLFNGAVRLFGAMADGKNAEFSDVFYFFDTRGKYIESVKFMISLLVRLVCVTIGFSLPAIVVYSVSQYTYHKDFAVVDSKDKVTALVVVSIVLLIVDVISVIIFNHRYIFAMILYSCHDLSIKDSFAVGSQIAKRQMGSLIKLTLSFVPWYLLLFFVVPFVYVYPYAIMSYTISAKYLFASAGLDLKGNSVNQQETMTVENLVQTEDSFVDRVAEVSNEVSVTEAENDLEKADSDNTLITENSSESEEDFSTFTKENTIDEITVAMPVDEQDEVGVKSEVTTEEPAQPSEEGVEF